MARLALAGLVDRANAILVVTAFDQIANARLARIAVRLGRLLPFRAMLFFLLDNVVRDRRAYVIQFREIYQRDDEISCARR